MQPGQGHDGSFVAGLVSPVSRVTADHLRHCDDPCFDWAESDSSSPTLWFPAPGAMVAVPAHFTLGYEYPLLVSLADGPDFHHGCGTWLSRISDRNFVVLSLLPQLFGGALASAERSSLSIALHRFASLLRVVEREIPLAAGRRFVVGHGTSCTSALYWLVAKPDWFAGAVALRPRSLSAPAFRAAADSLDNRAVLWLAEAEQPSIDEIAWTTALATLGIAVTVRAGSASPEAEINRWVMSQVPSAVTH